MSPRPRISLLGAPWDRSSSFARGAAEAPPAIRRALWSPSTNSATELGVDVTPDSLDDQGDVPLASLEASDARHRLETAVAALRSLGATPLVLGGDHSITYPVLRAFGPGHVATILHVDAHGDLYDEFPAFAPSRFGEAGSAFAPSRFGEAGSAFAAEGASVELRPVPGATDRFSHACPFARIMEEGLTTRLIQVGIRTATPHLRAQAARFGVEVYGMDRWSDAPVEALQGPVYVSLDLDGLDPAFAPGVAHPEPGGLSTRDVVSLLHRLRAPIAGGDIVELNPRLDTRDLTARVAAKLLKELVAVAVRNTHTP